MGIDPVLLICAPSRNPHGGVESILADLCRNLPSYGIRPVLGLTKGFRFNDPDRYRAAYPGVTTVDIEGTSGTREGRIQGLRRVLRKVNPDLVLVARVFDAYDVVARFKQKHGRPRLAVTVQVYESPYIYDAGLFRNNIDVCITSGELVRQAMIQWSGLPEDRVVSIPGGVRPPKVNVQPRSPGEILQLGYVGRIEASQKRIFDLIPFLTEMDHAGFSYSFQLIGSGSAEKELLQRLEAWIRNGKVTYHGWQDHEALYTKFFPHMDCLVHFARTEGVTIAPREAMVHGVVPVISEFTGLKAEGHFKNGVNALTFPVGDVRSAVLAITRLAKEHELMRTLSHNAIRSQSGKYSYDGAIQLWAECLTRCLQSPMTSGPLPKMNRSPDGRLARLRIPPEVAEQIRKFLRIRYVHQDPGSEWPTASGLMTPDAEESILKFSTLYETNTVDQKILNSQK